MEKLVRNAITKSELVQRSPFAVHTFLFGLLVLQIHSNGNLDDYVGMTSRVKIILCTACMFFWHTVNGSARFLLRSFCTGLQTFPLLTARHRISISVLPCSNLKLEQSSNSSRWLFDHDRSTQSPQASSQTGLAYTRQTNFPTFFKENIFFAVFCGVKQFTAS